MTAKISELFVSYQGEGPFMGSRQIFVRFYGCNLSCQYCDTVQESYRSFTKEALLGKVLDLGEDYNELVFTGGEPLMHADFLKGFITLFRQTSKKKIYLETNGTLPSEMSKVKDMVDIVAMDIKLPSSTGSDQDVWSVHEDFIKKCERKHLILKAVVSDSTLMEDIKRMGALIKNSTGTGSILFNGLTVVLQRISEGTGISVPPDEEILFFFKEYLRKETGLNVLVMGQMHKFMGIK